MRTKLFAVIGGGAVVASALIVGATSGGLAQAGTGAGVSPNIVYAQPTQKSMTFGVTVTVASHAPTTLATSMASPVVKATPAGAECNTTGMCP